VGWNSVFCVVWKCTPIILFADFFSFLLANLIPFDIYAASLIQFVSWLLLLFSRSIVHGPGDFSRFSCVSRSWPIWKLFRAVVLQLLLSSFSNILQRVFPSSPKRTSTLRCALQRFFGISKCYQTPDASRLSQFVISTTQSYLGENCEIIYYMFYWGKGLIRATNEPTVAIS
jgi:hypothetical protein